MKKFNWIAAWLLPSVTFGIYAIYMWHVMAKNVNAMAAAKGQKTIMGYIPAFLLGFVTFGIYPLYWTYKFFKLHTEVAQANNVELKPTNNPILLFLIMWVPIYSFYVLCDINNKNVDGAAA